MTVPGFGISGCDFIQTDDLDGLTMSSCFGDDNHIYNSGKIGTVCACGKKIIKAEGIFERVVN